MNYSTLKPPTKAEIEQSERHKQRRDIESDIKSIKTVLTESTDENVMDLHVFLDGKYSAYVPNWNNSMYGYVPDYGFNYELIGRESLIHNLKLMSAKLVGFQQGYDTPGHKSYSSSNNVSVNVSNNNEISISVSFEDARQKISDMSSLTDEETQNILSKISELEEIINSKEKKKTKWEKAKSLLVWLADKSFDVGMTLLPLLLKIQE